MNKKLGKSLALFTSAGFIGTLTQVVKGKLMAMLIGPAGVGVYTQLSSLFNLLFNLGSLGFRNGIIKRISISVESEDAASYQAQYTTVLIFLMVFSLVFIAILALFSIQISHYLFNDNGNNSDLVIITMLAVPFSVMANFYRSMMSGHSAVRKIVTSQIIADIVSLIPFVILIYIELLKGAIISFVIYQFLKLIFYTFYFNKIRHFNYSKFPRIIYFNWIEIRDNLKFGMSGLLLTTTNILVTIYIASYIIELFGEAEYGLYAMAIRVATLYLGAIYANSSSFYFPLLVKTKNLKELQYTVMANSRFYLYILPPLMALMMVGGEIFITVLFSSEFSLSATLLLFVVPGDFFRINAETISLPLLAKEKFLAYKSGYFIWAISFLLLTYYVGIDYGLQGIAFSYLLSQFISFLFSIILSWTILKIKLDAQYVVALLLGVLLIFSSILLMTVSKNIILTYCFSFFILFIWFLLSCLQKEFKNLLKNTFIKFKREKNA